MIVKNVIRVTFWILIISRISAKKGKSRNVDGWPQYYSVDFDQLPKDFLPDNRPMRRGHPTDTDSCDHIRGVPTDLGIEIDRTFYKKFTEAYGIPILGSIHVTDEGLKRSCYTVRHMLASCFDIRISIFKIGGRVVVIADNELPRSIPELSDLPPVVDSTTRGFGGTLGNPVISVGDENQRCDRDKDRMYPMQNILVHEFAHAIHLLGANLVRPGFARRLKMVYDKSMSEGKWYFKNGSPSYAAVDEKEFFAMGVSFYYNSYNRDDYKFKNMMKVTGRASLADYDPDLFHLIEEIFSCDNEFIHRCAYHDNPSSYSILVSRKSRKQANCDKIAAFKKFTPQQCFEKACELGAKYFATMGKRCFVLSCPDDKLEYVDATPSWAIFAVECAGLTVEKENAQTLEMHCVNPPDDDRCETEARASSEIQNGMRIRKPSICREHGGCPFKKKCFYPAQDCYDKSYECYKKVRIGACEADKSRMIHECPLSCGYCDEELEEIQIKEKEDPNCKDKLPLMSCLGFKAQDTCRNSPFAMKVVCKKTCDFC